MTKEILLEYWRGTICPTVVYSMTQLMIAPSDFEMELMPYVEVCFSAFIEKKSMVFSSILTTQVIQIIYSSFDLLEIFFFALLYSTNFPEYHWLVHEVHSELRRSGKSRPTSDGFQMHRGIFIEKSFQSPFLLYFQIHDIEENFWEPKYGLKGKIDITMKVIARKKILF